MESYRRRPLETPVITQGPEVGSLSDPVSLLRRLIPFPEVADVLSPLGVLPLSAGESPARRDAVASVVPDIASPQAASIISQAASILDEEMAKGVLAARRGGPGARHGHSSASHPVLRQVHELVDNLAAIWPNVHGAHAHGVGPSPSPPVASDVDPLAEVRPRAAVKPGQRATISMTVSNSESRPVHLVPGATDLLGSRDGRIGSALLQFRPADFQLAPQEERELEISLTVPAEAAPGCYSGLLVVKGVDYLRALITIDVA